MPIHTEPEHYLEEWLNEPVPTHRVVIDTDEHGVYLLRLWAEHEWRNMKVISAEVIK
jgi:hypothetical protein